MNYSQIKIPTTLRESHENFAVSALQLALFNSIEKPSAKDREDIETAKANLFINAAPTVVPIVANIISDIVRDVSRIFAPRPLAVTRAKVVFNGPIVIDDDSPTLKLITDNMRRQSGH